MKKLNTSHILAARGIYLCLLTVYAIAREILVLQKVVGSSLLTFGFFGAGMVLALLCFLASPKPHLHKRQWLPMAFLALCGVSIVLNIRHDLFSNIKAFAWMCLYFFLLMPGGWDAEWEGRTWQWVMWTAVATLSVAALLSLPMYLYDVDYSYVRENNFPYNLGFSREYMRLWGLYNDPNTSGVYSMVGICFCVFLFAKNKKLLPRILLVLAVIFQYFLLVLGNSRTVWVAYLVGAAWIGVYVAWSCSKGALLKRIGITVLTLALSVTAAQGLFQGVKYVFPYVKVAVQTVTTEETNAAVHLLYDVPFRASGLNITAGYYEPPAEEKPDVEKPSSQKPEKKPGAVPEVEMLDRGDKKEDVSNGRFQKWEEVLAVVLHKPVFGASPRGINEVARQIAPESSVAQYGFAAHNSLLEVVAGTGAAGLLVILALLVLLAWSILKTAFTRKFDPHTALFGTALLLMMCEMMFISDVFFVLTFGGVAFWMAAGRILDKAMSGKAPEIEE